MSDSYQTIADVDASESEAPQLAERLRHWLVHTGAILPDLTDCTLSDPGHPPGPKAREFCDGEMPPLDVDGVEFEVGRQVFHAGGNGLELRCDACEAVFEPDIDSSIDAWMEARSEEHT
ncbi:MAG: hypothetical protein ACF8LL_00170, partial [Phycisphaerales bacterium]